MDSTKKDSVFVKMGQQAESFVLKVSCAPSYHGGITGMTCCKTLVSTRNDGDRSCSPGCYALQSHSSSVSLVLELKRLRWVVVCMSATVSALQCFGFRLFVAM